MKYLKSYKHFESVSTDVDILDEIKDCFLGVSDLIESGPNSGVKVNEFSTRKVGRTMKDLTIGVTGIKYVVNIIPQLLNYNSPDLKYKPTNMSDDIISEIENSISLLKSLDLNVTIAGVEWANGFDYAAGERGPGMSNKRFKEGGIIPSNLDGFEKGTYSLDVFYDFLRSRGDKIRWVKLLIS